MTFTLQRAEPSEQRELPSVPVEKFGKDHWSAFGYIECRIVDNEGIPDRNHLRCDPDRHPGLGGSRIDYTSSQGKKKYPTRLAGDNEFLPDHDDWDCLYDLEAVGLLNDIGTGVNPVFRLTELGHTVAAALRKHKAEGKMFATFKYPE